MIGLITSLFFSHAMAMDFISVGKTPNQLHFHGGRLYSINSGFQSVPSISRIDTEALTSSQFLLPVESNPYRAALSDGQLWMTMNMTDEFVRLPLAELGTSENASYEMLFVPDMETRGAESVALLNGQFWVAYTNMQPDYSFGPADIFVYDRQTAAAGPVKKIRFEAHNAKNLAVLDNNHLAISFGDFGKKNGRIAVVSGDLLKTEAVDIRVPLESGALPVTYYKTGGMPGHQSFDGANLWACDLDPVAEQTGRFFKIDLKAQTLSTHSLPFASCAVILAGPRHLYVLGLNNGDGKNDKRHLFILDKGTLQTSCALELLPEGARSPLLAFPSDMIKFKDGQGEKLAVSLSQIGKVALLKLDGNGLPLDCGHP